MKANRPVTLIALATLALAGCSTERKVAPSPAPDPSPAPLPPRAPAPTIDWRQAPATPGNWMWSMENGQSVARFAAGTLVLQCDRAAGIIRLARAGTASGPVVMTVLTTAMSRPLTGRPEGTPSMLVAAIPVRDPILDAMTFSRGRFAIEAAGLPTLVVPSWAEVSRVIEDCR